MAEHEGVETMSRQVQSGIGVALLLLVLGIVSLRALFS
jgi:hypothetical protein